MHNGLLIEEGCYYGPWMTEVIKGLRGHHEPQEEVVFDAIIRRLSESIGGTPVIVEFGSFWSYYSMWFCRALPGGHAVAIEPDPAYLAIGRRNALLNGLGDRIQFRHGAVGAAPGEDIEFEAESDGRSVTVMQYDLDSVLQASDLQHADVLMIDIQGFETVLLERARRTLLSGAVRFAIVSTHHWSISGDHLSHQKTRDMLLECGAHIIAEHSIAESFSGDGLIAVSFDERDADLVVPVSRARPQDSLYGEPERELDVFAGIIADRDATIEHFRRHTDRVEAELLAAQRELAATVEHFRAHVERIEAELGARPEPAALSEIVASGSAPCGTRPDHEGELVAAEQSVVRLQAELDAVHRTKLWRWSAPARTLFGRLQRMRPGRARD